MKHLWEAFVEGLYPLMFLAGIGAGFTILVVLFAGCNLAVCLLEKAAK